MIIAKIILLVFIAFLSIQYARSVIKDKDLSRKYKVKLLIVFESIYTAIFIFVCFMKF